MILVMMFSYQSKYVEIQSLHDFFNFRAGSAINLMHINCRSINKNFSNILDLLHVIDGKLMAIPVTETWLKLDTEKYFQIPGYKFVAKSRPDKIGGGIGIFVNKDYEFTVRSDLCHMTEYIECLFIELHQQGKANILIGCIYRPPNTDLNLFNSEILNILNAIDKEKNKVIVIAGDYNLDFLKINNHMPTAEFFNNMLSYALYPTINNPTRISDTSSSLIDNIFTNATPSRCCSCILRHI